MLDADRTFRLRWYDGSNGTWLQGAGQVTMDGTKDDQTSYSMQQHRAAPALPEQGRRPARRGTPAPHEILNIRYAVRPHQPTNNASIKRPSPLPGQDRGGALAGKAVQRVIQERISMLSSAEAELRLHNHEL